MRRYIAQLIEMEVPVESIRGRHGGYRVSSGYRMPPLMLSDEEALTLLLGLVIGRRSGVLPIDEKTVDGAVDKLRRVLPRATTSRLDALRSSADLTLVGPSELGPSKGSVDETDAKVLLVLAEAVHDRHPLAIDYVRGDGHASQRTIIPYGIVARSHRWYLTGHESRSGQIRTFRVDRISNPTVLAGSFNVPESFDASATVSTSLAATPWRHQVSVLVAGTIDELRSQLPAGLVTLELATTNDAQVWTRVCLRAERLDWVAPFFAGLGRSFFVEEPDTLRQHVRSLAGRLLVACGDNPSMQGTSTESRSPSWGRIDDECCGRP